MHYLFGSLNKNEIALTADSDPFVDMHSVGHGLFLRTFFCVFHSVLSNPTAAAAAASSKSAYCLVV